MSRKNRTRHRQNDQTPHESTSGDGPITNNIPFVPIADQPTAAAAPTDHTQQNTLNTRNNLTQNIANNLANNLTQNVANNLIQNVDNNLTHNVDNNLIQNVDNNPNNLVRNVDNNLVEPENNLMETVDGVTWNNRVNVHNVDPQPIRIQPAFNVTDVPEIVATQGRPAAAGWWCTIS